MIDVNDIRRHLSARELTALKDLLSDQDPADIRDAIEDLSPPERVVVFRLLQKDTALHVFEQMDVDLQKELVFAFTHERAVELFTELEPDDRVRLLDELPAKVAKRLVSALSPGERWTTNILMGYAPQTAGRIMTPKYFSLKKSLTVAEALERIRRSGRSAETLNALYVIDDTRRLEGAIDLGELVMADPDRTIGELMDTHLVSVRTDADQEDVARLLQDRDLLVVPVLDSEDRLVGIITVDDAMDILEEEATEDLYEKAGLLAVRQVESGKSRIMINGSMFDIWRVRLPFLMITLVGGMLAGAVIGAFEEVLVAITATAIFIPVIMDMGGNVGTQSATIFTRALILGDIDVNRFMRHWLREVGNGASMGLMLGVAGGVVAAVWQGMPRLGLAVGISLFFTITVATALGFLIPWLLTRIGWDQAAGANPIITTVKDVTGLTIYFVSVSLLLSQLL